MLDPGDTLHLVLNAGENRLRAEATPRKIRIPTLESGPDAGVQDKRKPRLFWLREASTEAGEKYRGGLQVEV